LTLLRLPLLILSLALLVGLPLLILSLSLLVLSLSLLLLIVVLARLTWRLLRLLRLAAVFLSLVRTALRVHDAARAHHGYDRENEQKGKSISVVTFHDYLQFGREG
jgi:membrane protein implicated in regulation of membrane protease activity